MNATPGPAVAVFGSSAITLDSEPWQQAFRCGELLAARGFTVVTGGYGGAMEAVSHGAADKGAHIVGVTAPAVFPGRSGVNRHVIEEEPAPSLTVRIHRLLERSDAVIALPGSIGTFTELVMAWNLAHVAPFSASRPLPIAAVGEVWRTLVTAVAAAIGEARTPVTCVADVDDAVEHVAAALG